MPTTFFTYCNKAVFYHYTTHTHTHTYSPACVPGPVITEGVQLSGLDDNLKGWEGGVWKGTRETHTL